MTERTDLRSGIINKVIFGIMIAFSIGVFISIFFWVYPRDIITLDIQTDKDVYTTADENFLVTSTIERFASAESEYESVLDCTTTRYGIVTFGAITKPSPPETSTVPLPIPPLVTPAIECRIQLTGKHRVEILPFMTRVYFTEFQSNSFSIIGE